MKCDLELISHNNVADKFKDTFIRCPLFAHEEAGMHVPGMLCVNCCLRIQMVNEKKTELLLKGDISKEGLENDPNSFVIELTGLLRQYGEVVPKISTHNWSEIFEECAMCKAGQNESIVATEATKISQVGRDELRV